MCHKVLCGDTAVTHFMHEDTEACPVTQPEAPQSVPQSYCTACTLNLRLFTPSPQ